MDERTRRRFIRTIVLASIVALAGWARGGLALSAMLLMAPGLLVSGGYDVLSLVGVASGEVTVAVDLLLRGVGLALFVALVTKNRRAAPRQESGATAEVA